MNRNIVSATLCGASILAGWSAPLDGGEIAKDVSIPEIIRHVKENEAKLESVVIEGSSENIQYDVSGKPTFVQVDRSYRFSRSGPLFRVERQGEQYTKQKKSDTLVPVERDETIFCSPVSVVYVYNSRITHARKALFFERPTPFPLQFGYQFRWDYESGEILPFSTETEKLLKDGTWSAREIKDPTGQNAQSPNLVLLERNERWHNRFDYRYRYWIDPDRGYLVVKQEYHQLIPALNRELLLAKEEVVPKQFNGVWFVESAHSDNYNVVGENPAAKEIFLTRIEETFKVTKFQAGVKFKPGELEFSEKNFPQLQTIQNAQTNELVDVQTGKPIIIPGSTPGQKPPPDAGK